jgi:hypothetical protein
VAPRLTLAEPPSYLFLTVDLPFAALLGRTTIDDVNDQGQLLVNDADGPQARLVDGREGRFDVVTIACPDAETSTAAKSLNTHGDVVGFCTDGNGTHGFLRLANGDLTVLNAPGALATHAIGVNDWRLVVGDFRPPTGPQRGFLLLPGGLFLPFDVPLPGVVGTYPTAVNNAGQIVGFTLDAHDRSHGFLLDATGFQAVEAPDALDTVPTDLNDQGQIVGVYTDSSEGLHSFVRQGSDFVTLDLQAPGPLVQFTDASGVNNRGQIAGRVVLVIAGAPVEVFNRGFLATPLAEGGGDSEAVVPRRPRRQGQHPRLSLRGWPDHPPREGIVLPSKLLGRGPR